MFRNNYLVDALEPRHGSCGAAPTIYSVFHLQIAAVLTVHRLLALSHYVRCLKFAASSSALFLSALQILDAFYVDFGSEVIFLAQNVYPMPALVTVPLDALAICTSDGYRTNPCNAYGRGTSPDDDVLVNVSH